jgi:hypothetical protein
MRRYLHSSIRLHGMMLEHNVVGTFPFHLSYHMSHCESGSSVSVVSGYGLDDRAIEVRSPAEAKGFFL